MSTTISSRQLVDKVNTLHGDSPIFSILLGAGASATSGIATGEGLVEKWRTQFDTGTQNEEDKAKKQDWYRKSTEYSTLFEHHYNTPALRRQFIEKCTTGAYPYWGYLYLVHLVEAGVFNTVLTTNFDDLVNEAFHAYTADLRPLVCSHEGGMASFKVTSQRPKVIKLHGDYLFDDLKNTLRELQSLEEEANKILSTIAKEHGLIVIGYGGKDESIMGELGNLLKDSTNFANGIYWCLRSGQEQPTRLEPFSNDERLQFVSVEGFDEIMGQLHSAIVGVPPEIVTAPFNALASRLSRLLTVMEKSATGDESKPTESPTVQHAETLAAKLRLAGPEAVKIGFPVSLVGLLAFQAKEYGRARGLLFQAIRTPRPTVADFVYFFECLRHEFDADAFNTVCDILKKSVGNEGNDSTFLLNGTLSLVHAKKYDEGKQLCDILDQAIKENPEVNKRGPIPNRLNRLQIKVHQGESLSDADKQTLAGIFTSTESVVEKFACHVLSGFYEEAMELVEKKKDEAPKDMLDWPIIELLPKADQNRLRELMGEGRPHYASFPLKFDITYASLEEAPKT